MTALQFTNNQRIKLTRQGLSHAQVNRLEQTLPLAHAWMAADASPKMTDVRDVLNESHLALHTALHSTLKLLNPTTAAQREASMRVMNADPDATGEDGAVMETFHALAELACVIDRALEELPINQRRAITSINLFQRIDKALLEGFAEDTEIGITGTSSRHYRHIKPARTGAYLEIVKVYYAAIGRNAENPDRAIRNYMQWCLTQKEH